MVAVVAKIHHVLEEHGMTAWVFQVEGEKTIAFSRSHFGLILFPHLFAFLAILLLKQRIELPVNMSKGQYDNYVA